MYYVILKLCMISRLSELIEISPMVSYYYKENFLPVNLTKNGILNLTLFSLIEMIRWFAELNVPTKSYLTSK